MSEEYVLSEDGQSIVKVANITMTISKRHILARKTMIERQISLLQNQLVDVQEQLDLFPAEE